MEMIGSTYEGQKIGTRPHGEGVLRYRNGTEYHGSFQNGKFEGKGRLVFPSGTYIEGQWAAGELVEQKTFFADRFPFHEHDWDYCSAADRRFYSERVAGVAPLPRT